MGPVSISFLLLAAAIGDAPPADAVHSVGDAHQEKVKCRTSSETGSRLRRIRVCLTEREWKERQRAEGRELDRGGTILGDTEDGGYIQRTIKDR